MPPRTLEHINALVLFALPAAFRAVVACVWAHLERARFSHKLHALGFLAIEREGERSGAKQRDVISGDKSDSSAPGGDLPERANGRTANVGRGETRQFGSAKDFPRNAIHTAMN